MYIEFKSAKLRKRCEVVKEGQRVWGKTIAEKVVQRLNALKAADSMDDLSPLPPLRCHALRGSRQGQFAMDLTHPFRLVFQPLDELKEVQDDTGSVMERGVRILEVNDYHGKTR